MPELFYISNTEHYIELREPTEVMLETRQNIYRVILMPFFSEAGLNTVRMTMFKNFIHHPKTMKNWRWPVSTNTATIYKTNINQNSYPLTNETQTLNYCSESLLQTAEVNRFSSQPRGWLYWLKSISFKICLPFNTDEMWKYL